MRIIGERFNTSRKSVNRMVAERDAEALIEEAKGQYEAGAEILDVNAGSRKESEIDDLCWMIDTIQEAVPEAQLCIDSPNAASMEAVIDRVDKTYMLNSTTAEQARFEAMAPVIQARECDVVGLCIDDRGLPKTVEQTMENALRLVSELEALGVKRERIFLDPVIQAVSTNTNAAVMVLESMRRITQEINEVHLVCGLSNVSFGLPERHLLNRTFLTLAINAGLDTAILDPRDGKLIGALRATELLLDRDPWCQAYTRAYREGRIKA